MKSKLTAIEIGIFSIISVIFVNSIYSLVTNKDVVPIQNKPPTREVASVPLSVTNQIELSCQIQDAYETSLPKIRLAGNFCRPDRTPASKELTTEIIHESSVFNENNKFQATIFNDQQVERFSTDFIPLIEGDNNFTLLLKYKSGLQFKSKFVIKKKSQN